MTGHHETAEIDGSAAHCTGREGEGHEPFEIVVPPQGAVPCPVCGRMFTRARPVSYSRAAWPKPE